MELALVPAHELGTNLSGSYFVAFRSQAEEPRPSREGEETEWGLARSGSGADAFFIQPGGRVPPLWEDTNFQPIMPFDVKGAPHQCGALPDGWNDSPQVFVKIVRMLVECLRSLKASRDRRKSGTYDPEQYNSAGRCDAELESCTSGAGRSAAPQARAGVLHLKRGQQCCTSGAGRSAAPQARAAVLHLRREAQGFCGDELRRAHIVHVELAAVHVMSTHTFPQGEVASLCCDNKGIVAMLSHFTSRDPDLMTRMSDGGGGAVVRGGAREGGVHVAHVGGRQVAHGRSNVAHGRAGLCGVRPRRVQWHGRRDPWRTGGGAARWRTGGGAGKWVSTGGRVQWRTGGRGPGGAREWRGVRVAHGSGWDPGGTEEAGCGVATGRGGRCGAREEGGVRCGAREEGWAVRVAHGEEGGGVVWWPREGGVCGAREKAVWRTRRAGAVARERAAAGGARRRRVRWRTGGGRGAG
ncbi:hypothetical protein CYMTET_49455 [Cymbomonas tetramitiformis]|uniref:Uncharacterized protein n=1 Tax=Cymbomonas tetramitiformis TaxID=36881 RepID=A0AAE0BS33_9CHLO|nr:hypothetical protein CYMTET_49455 [Cymbomonas tetramitiformis]